MNDKPSSKPLKSYLTRKNIITAIIVFVLIGDVGRAALLFFGFTGVFYVFRYKGRRAFMSGFTKSMSHYERLQDAPKPPVPDVKRAKDPFDQPDFSHSVKIMPNPPVKKDRYSDGPIKSTPHGLFGWLLK